MKLADLSARVVTPLGEWPKPTARIKRLERWRRYRLDNLARRAAAERERRSAA